MLQELETERLELIDEIDNITLQLRDTNRLDMDTGDRLDGYAYLEWKQKAETAKKHRMARLREVNAELNRARKQKNEEVNNSIHVKLDRIIELLEEEE